MQSTCIKCGGMHFELSDSHLKIEGTKLAFVQCTTCGGVVGIVEITKKVASHKHSDDAHSTTKDSFHVEL